MRRIMTKLAAPGKRGRLPGILAGVTAVCAVAGTAAFAAITSTSGAVVQIAPPGSVTEGVLQSDTEIRAFDERQCVTLTSDLSVDISASGGSGVIPAGTPVSSQLLHFDPVSTHVSLSGSITTDATIIGAITTQAALDASDSLGAAATTYPTGNIARGLEADDSVSISGGQLTLSTTLTERFHFDQIRVISHCAPAPPTGRANCVETVNPAGENTPPAGSTTLPGPKGGQNEDGFYQLTSDPASAGVTVIDEGSGTSFGPFPSGTRIKYTQAPGATPGLKKIGSANGNANAVTWHITGTGDAVAVSGDGVRVSCKVPPPPK
jgi:hypothetical protein